jgi:hypothetical protein
MNYWITSRRFWYKMVQVIYCWLPEIFQVAIDRLSSWKYTPIKMWRSLHDTKW